MLTKDDLSQIRIIMHSEIQTETRKIIQEETRKIIQEETPKIVEVQIAPLKKQMISFASSLTSLRNELRSQIRKVRRDINMVIKTFDNDYSNLRIRVEKIEDHLHLAHS